MSKKKEIIDPQRISLLVSGKTKLRLQKNVLMQSQEEKRQIPLTEFLRRMIDLYCPEEKSQMEVK